MSFEYFLALKIVSLVCIRARALDVPYRQGNDSLSKLV